MSENKALRWVKASERLPDGPRNENSKVIVRPINNSKLATVTFAWSADPDETNWYDSRYYFDDTEWLEEYVPDTNVVDIPQQSEDQPGIDREGGMPECTRHPHIPDKALLIMEEKSLVWNDEIAPHYLKGMVQGYLLAIGKLVLYKIPEPASKETLPTEPSPKRSGENAQGDVPEEIDPDWDSRKIDRLCEVITLCEDEIRELNAFLSSIKGERDKLLGAFSNLETTHIDDLAAKEREGKDLHYGGYRQVAVNFSCLISIYRKEVESSKAEIQKLEAIIEGKNLEIAEMKEAITAINQTYGRNGWGKSTLRDGALNLCKNITNKYSKKEEPKP